MTTAAGQDPLVKKLLLTLARERSRTVVDLKTFAVGRQHAAELQKTVISPQTMTGLQPARAIYVYVQNQVSIISETITALPAIDKLAVQLTPGAPR